jgi:hypothetical protein
MTEYTIRYHTGDKVLLEYDHAAHSYVVDELKIPNVTTLIDGVFPKYLTEWAARCGADYWKTHSDETENMYHGIINAHKDVSGAARDIGHETHYWIEEYINSSIKNPNEVDWKLGSLGDKAKNAVKAFLKWEASHDIVWMGSEKKVYSKEYDYAGTIDAIAMINGKYCIVDFKTSAKIYKESYVQLSAYAQAVEEIHGKPVDLAVVLRLDKEEDKYQEAAFIPSDYFHVFLMAMQMKKFQSTRIKKEKL